MTEYKVIIFNNMYFIIKILCVYVWVLCASPGAHRVQKRATDSMEVQLEAVANHLTWALGTELRFSARTAHTCSDLLAICSSFLAVVGCDKPFGLNRNQRRKVLLHLRG